MFLPPWSYAGTIMLAMLGTTAATYVLHRMSEEGFRKWSRAIILTISAIFVVRGLLLLMSV